MLITLLSFCTLFNKMSPCLIVACKIKVIFFSKSWHYCNIEWSLCSRKTFSFFLVLRLDTLITFTSSRYIYQRNSTNNITLVQYVINCGGTLSYLILPVLVVWSVGFYNPFNFVDLTMKSPCCNKPGQFPGTIQCICYIKTLYYIYNIIMPIETG